MLPPDGMSGRRLLHAEERSININAKIFIKVLLGDLLHRDECSTSRVGKEDVEATFFLFDN